MAIQSSGVPLLGLLPDGRPISFPGDAHLFTVAKPGAGKNRCVILPNLLLHPGSVLTLDFKGENATVTARWRERLGPSYVFDPFKIVEDVDLPASGRCGFDPVAFVARHASPFSAAQIVADALIISPSQGESHWAEAAKLILAGTLLFVAKSPLLDNDPDIVKALGPRRRTMRTVWAIIADPRYAGLQIDMVASTDAHISAQGSILSGMRLVQSKDGPVLEKVPNIKENAGKVSTLTTQCIGLFAEEKIMDALEGPSVDFGSLSKVTSSAYICLPGSLASVHSRFMRLLVRCALAQIEDAGLKSHDSTRPSTLFFLDEFATLGTFRTIVEAMGRMRGYGLKFWTFVQNLSQLKEHYGETWSQIPGNAGVIQYFGGTMDEFTADYISKRTGESTAKGRSQGSSTTPGHGVSTNENLFGRPVMFPGDVAALPPGEQILLLLGVNGPVRAGMMYRDKPEHFPEFNRWNSSADRKRPVYRPAPPPPQPRPASMVISCPADGKSLRVPTDRGQIKVKCPCGHQWKWSPPDMLAAE